MTTTDDERRDASVAAQMQIIQREDPPPSQLNDALVLGLSFVAAVSGIVFGVAITVDAPLPLYGFALTIGLFALGYAIRRFFTDRFPDVEAIEKRSHDSPTAGESEGEGLDELAEVRAVGRRPVLLWSLVGSGVAFAAGLLAPIIQLGPRPGNTLRSTLLEAGRRVVTTDGEPVRPEEIANGGVVSGWPEGAIGQERSAVVVLRLSSAPREPTNFEWIVDERVVAYSKICTHAGCPVALYREQDSALFCPCHQSTFDAIRGAVPTFGPAARALPQLPLGLDDQGFLVATRDFTEQVGPSFD